jgi:hypothetical protein
MFHIITNFLNKIYNYFENENLIVDKTSKIWVGNYITGENIDFMKKNDIKLVINCTENLPWIKQTNLSIRDLIVLNKIKFERIPVLDSLHEKDMVIMYNHLDSILNTIFNSYLRNENILIYCHMGRQRSQIVMAAFLYKYREHFSELGFNTKEDVFNYILSKRPQAFSYGLRVNFLPSFNKYFHFK